MKIYSKNDLIKGAKVYIDGKYAGKIEEDVFSKEIPAGKHEILITSEKIEDVKFKFEVVEYGEFEKEIEGKLAKRVVKIITEPTGAKVYVNGKYFGKTPKFVKLEVSKKHLLSLAKYGYETLKTEIYIPSKGDVLNKNYELKKAKIPEIEWQNALGGSDWEEADSIIQTRDGGFVVAGYTWSNNGDVSGYHGKADIWVVKLDENGNIIWQKTLGGSDGDGAKSIIQTSDGGFVVAGYTGSNNGDVSGYHGGLDMWVVKLDENGNIVWQKTLGGSGGDGAKSIIQTSDGGFVVAGYTWSNNGDVSGYHGETDMWIVKLK